MGLSCQAKQKSDMLPAQMSTSESQLSGPWKGPAELVLAASIARRYYIDGLSKIELAEEFGVSRFKVARLVEMARTHGLVRIEVAHPGNVHVELSRRLQDVFELEHCVVVDTHEDDPAALRKQLGLAAAELLAEVVTPDDVLGLAWARTVSAMVTQLRRLPAVPVVQLTGALSRSTGSSSAMDDSSIDVVRVAARVSGGPAYLFFAPFVVPDAATARALRQQPDVALAFSKIPTVTKAVTGIGRWAPGQSTLYDAATVGERQSLTRQGVCADVGGVFLADDGTPLETDLTQRLVGISAAEMAGVKEVLGFAYGEGKQPATLAALRSGLVHSLITSSSLATALLEGEPPDAGGSGEDS
jgi:DNA-binding transcriptional regulator LsrR (DeoR family)